MSAYRTISKPAEGPVFKEKKSKFIGLAIPVRTEEDINQHLEKLRLDHQTAAHICYAWILGSQMEKYRANDDGEPHNSAGMPILGQIKAMELTDILVAVVRYYGGKKLGVGGLVAAYRSASKQVLEAATIIDKEIQHTYRIQCSYEMVDRVLQKARKKNLKVISKHMDESCKLFLALNPGEERILEEEIGYLKGVLIEKTNL